MRNEKREGEPSPPAPLPQGGEGRSGLNHGEGRGDLAKRGGDLDAGNAVAGDHLAGDLDAGGKVSFAGLGRGHAVHDGVGDGRRRAPRRDGGT